MQYTIRNVPRPVDRALREWARRQRKSLNEVALAALARGLGLEHAEPRRRNLERFKGSWVQDAATDRALDDQRQIDPEIWR